MGEHGPLKRGQVQNLPCENEFYLHDNKKTFSQERFCTWPRYKTEACGISEMAYLLQLCSISVLYSVIDITDHYQFQISKSNIFFCGAFPLFYYFRSLSPARAFSQIELFLDKPPSNEKQCSENNVSMANSQENHLKVSNFRAV